MNLDPQTLFFSLMINVTLMSVALTLGVRWDSRSGIRAWNVALVLQALAWAALIASYRAWPRSLATVGEDGRLPMPPVHEWDSWPFEGELRPKALRL